MGVVNGDTRSFDYNSRGFFGLKGLGPKVDSRRPA